MACSGVCSKKWGSLTKPVFRHLWVWTLLFFSRQCMQCQWNHSPWYVWSINSNPTLAFDSQWHTTPGDDLIPHVQGENYLVPVSTVSSTPFVNPIICPPLPLARKTDSIKVRFLLAVKLQVAELFRVLFSHQDHLSPLSSHTHVHIAFDMQIQRVIQVPDVGLSFRCGLVSSWQSFCCLWRTQMTSQAIQGY